MSNPTWWVEEGRPSWHQARAGHGSAARSGFSSKIQALRYMARSKRLRPHEPLRLVPPRGNPKHRETPAQTQRRLLRAIERADREGYTGYVGSKGGLFEYPRFRAIHRRYMHQPKRSNPSYSQVKAAYRRAVLTRSTSEKRIRGLFEAMKRREGRLPRKMRFRHHRAGKHAEALRLAARRRFVVGQRRWERGAPGSAAHSARGRLLSAAKLRADRYGRKANPMRRRRRRTRTAAQRAAYRRMIAGLRRYKARHRANPRGVYKRPKRKRHYVALGDIPEGQPTTGMTMLNRRRRKNRKRRRNPMARRRRHNRRRRRVAMANPRRHRRRHNRRRRRPHFVRARGRFYRRRSNPGIAAALKTVFAAGIPALGAGAVAGFVHNRWFIGSSKLVQIGVKVAQAAVWGMLFRRRPVVAYAAMGAALGSIGNDFGANFAGNKAAAVAALIQESPQAMGVLVNAMQGMGLQLDTGVSLGEAGTALDSGLPANSYTDVNLG